MSFEFVESSLAGVYSVTTTVRQDNRGVFLEMYRFDLFCDSRKACPVVAQTNISVSKKNVIRGLHYQMGYKPQTKLVSVVRGSIMDVVVDLRQGSPTLGRHAKFMLDDKDHKMVFIPKYCAHGFIALEDDTVVVYQCNNEYDPENDCGVRIDDPLLDIDWGISLNDAVCSEKDLLLPNVRGILACGGLQAQTGF